MAFQLATNLDLGAQLPLDTRTVVADQVGRNGLVTSGKAHPGLVVYVTSENKYYYYNNSNAWAEFGTSTPNIENLVYATGNQTISGKKTFATGIVSPLRIGNPDDLSDAKIRLWETSSYSYQSIGSIDGGFSFSRGGTEITLEFDNEEISLKKFPGISYRFLSGYNGTVPIDANVVHVTGGNETISGVKTFADTVRLASNKGVGFTGTGGANDFYGMYTVSTNGGSPGGPSQSGLSFYAGGTERFRIYNSGHIAFDDYGNLPAAVRSPKYKLMHLSSNQEFTAATFSMASRNAHTIFFGNNSGQFILGTEQKPAGKAGWAGQTGRQQFGWLFKSNLDYNTVDLFEGGTTQFFIDAESGYLSGLGNFIDRSGQNSLDWNNRIFSGNWIGNIQDALYTNRNQILQQKYYPYIASFFSNNSIKPYGMQIVGSTDAVNWEIIGTRNYSGSGLLNTDELRDPSIVKLNNKWVVAFTEDAFRGWPPEYAPRPDNSGYFGLLESTDLINWKYQRISLVNILRNNGLTGVTRLWAPEWFKEDNGDLYLTFSVCRTGWQNSPFGGTDGGGHMPYIIRATDYNLTGWTGFRRLSGSAFPLLPSFKTGVNHYSSFIDICIEKVSGTYYTPYSDGDNTETRLASSTGLFDGWTVLASGKTWYGTGFPYVGAPTNGTYKEGGVLRFYNGKWRLWIFDVYGTNSGIYSEGLTPTGMSFVSLIKNNLGYRFDHGTVIKNDNYAGLLNQFDDQTISGTKTFITKPFVNNTGIVLSGEAVPPLVDINNITTNFVFDSSLNSKLLTINANNNITGRVPTGLSTGYNVSFLQAGTGQLFISGSGGAIIRQRLNLYSTAGQYSIASLLHYSGNQFVLYGDLI